MEIKWIADTLHSVYTVPCNMEGEPEFIFSFKPSAIHVKYRYEVRSGGDLKSISWTP